ncbi:hypothetical protein GYMLUDRAFT_72076 [Collybiopsis luxurians FD-317 M1]|uniref:HIT-type domain-containing protein n=1 Tax=Collybiopsis luxurians FD-317 M1 TaxID=944289 RepID=A0A0D0D2E0_9AGAR|nr:hypothetical protein GYMLUDRAFT_72076 [Collybiopsis luxurians FD-317 M1]
MQEICKICTRQVSRYTCPECNIPYCSSTCFKSPLHTNCSEAFYKKQIQENVQPAQSQERLKMMEILKRFEENNFDIEDEGDDDEDDEDDLARRFESVDIASASPDALWSLLTQEERDRFIKALEDPSSSLAQNLLQRLESKPWWEEPSSSFPELIQVPESMVKPFPTGPPLIYNMIAICIAYAFTTRQLATSSLSSDSDADHQQATGLLTSLVPFLFDKKSTTLYMNISDAVQDVWSRLDKSTINSNPTSPSSSSPSPSLFTILMLDTATLLRPMHIGVISSSSSSSSSSAPRSTSTSPFDIASHPNRTPIYVLSDLHHLFDPLTRKTSSSSSSSSSSSKHITHKLLFYAAHILSTPPLVLKSLTEDVERRMREMEKVDQEAEGASASTARAGTETRNGEGEEENGRRNTSIKPLIEEI